MQDRELIAQFAPRRAPDAFAQMVNAYTGMVYSAARRQLGDSHLAEDVTQAVFILLWRKAPQIRDGMLAAWLLRATVFASRDAARMRTRRGFHERRAAEMRSEEIQSGQSGNQAHPAWEDYSGDVDAALAKLRPKDRQAIALRYLRGFSMSEVGSDVGISEEAARKRVNRAMERLRGTISSGKSLSSETLAAQLAARGQEAAPAALPGLIIAAAGAAAKGTLIWAIAQKAQHAMTWIKIKIASAVAAAVILTGAGTTAVVVIAGTGQSQTPAPVVLQSFPLLATAAAPAPTGAVATGSAPDPSEVTPITMHFRNTDARDAIRQLAAQANVSMNVWPDYYLSGQYNSSPVQLTMDLNAVPFWYAVDQICGATHSQVQKIGGNATISVLQGSPGMSGLCGILYQSGPITFVATSVEHNRGFRLSDKTTQRNDSVQLEMLVDPAVLLLNYDNVAVLSRAVDDKGTSMVVASEPQQAQPNMRNAFGDWRIPILVPILYPPSPGTEITDLAGSIRVSLASHFSPMAIEDATHSIGKSKSAGAYSMRLDSFTLNNAGNLYVGSIRVSLHRSADAPGRDIALSEQSINSVTLIDAVGERMTISVQPNGPDGDSATAEGSFGSSMGALPVKLQWNVPTQTKVETLPFEFKHLPLPKE
jgi:RNA polymerase sigma factor (sigma-70 family)